MELISSKVGDLQITLSYVFFKDFILFQGGSTIENTFRWLLPFVCYISIKRIWQTRSRFFSIYSSKVTPYSISLNIDFWQGSFVWKCALHCSTF